MRKLLTVFAAVVSVLIVLQKADPILANEFVAPWSNPGTSIVIDPYSLNPIDWKKLEGDKRVVGFIHKATEGDAPAINCGQQKNAEQRKICILNLKYYKAGIELYRTRRELADRLGYRWGAYHLGRAGDPIEQAKHFLEVADIRPSDLVALDIEGLDSKKWMSLKDAETFSRYLKEKIGRFPILYANHKVASHIAENKETYPVLARLPLWYARFKSDIRDVFPMGNWPTYTLWQFSSEINCKPDSECLYRVPGTDFDMDLNVHRASVPELKAKWPNIAVGTVYSD